MKIKNSLKRILLSYYEDLIFAKQFLGISNKYRIILVGTPEHVNVGDSILTIASKKYFVDYFPNHKVIELTLSDYNRFRKVIQLLTNRRDVFCCQPGGNMGNIWFESEKNRRDVLVNFKNNKVIFLPQTIDYDKTNAGIMSLKDSQNIYSKHKKLVIFAREKKSFELMKEYYPKNKVFLCPDLALFLDSYTKDNVRDTVLLCLRRDLEKNLSEEDEKRLIGFLGGRNYAYMDMYSDKIPNKENREGIVADKLVEFSKAEFVITDRLHGMLSCVLTQTPCVVMSNNNHKVRGVYEWIKDIPYIQFIERIDEIPMAIEKVLSVPDRKYNSSLLKPYFLQIEKEIKGE